MKVIRKICLGHGHLNQIVLCEVVNGHDSLVGAEVVALVFDPLYVAISDLPTVDSSKSPTFTPLK